MHEKDGVIEWTLRTQVPSLAKPVQCDTCENNGSEEGKIPSTLCSSITLAGTTTLSITITNVSLLLVSQVGQLF